MVIYGSYLGQFLALYRLYLVRIGFPVVNVDRIMHSYWMNPRAVCARPQGGPGVAQDARMVMARSANVLALKRTGQGGDASNLRWNPYIDLLCHIMAIFQVQKINPPGFYFGFPC